MFGNEVDYRLAKWLLLNMAKDGIITEQPGMAMPPQTRQGEKMPGF